MTLSGTGTPATRVAVTVEGRELRGFVRGNGRWDVPVGTMGAGRHSLQLTGWAPGQVAAGRTVTLEVD